MDRKTTRWADVQEYIKLFGVPFQKGCIIKLDLFFLPLSIGEIFVLLVNNL